ncbi:MULTISPECIES: hypothetical protein [unclassified Novosphingobium]|uniref:hypothetical protein n=1 Tax=unclassified Novosphingobium TaxID=2644732 RepID=UPI0025EA536B|nr:MULTISPECIES: hypothetical protein [unclassified Novosphingobium]HQV02482.1 hypothetical protein [Novosphingobium sp.]
MATVKPNPATRSPWRRRMLMLGLALIVALLAVFWKPLNGYAQAGTAYGARVACSCRFVGGRELSDCKKDFEPGMELVRLSEDAKARSVTASFPLLSSQTATYREGPGCQLEPWQS